MRARGEDNDGRGIRNFNIVPHQVLPVASRRINNYFFSIEVQRPDSNSDSNKTSQKQNQKLSALSLPSLSFRVNRTIPWLDREDQASFLRGIKHLPAKDAAGPHAVFLRQP